MADTLKKFHSLALRALERFVMVLFAVLVLTILWNVLITWLLKLESARSVVNASWNDWCDGYARIMLIWLSMLGAAIAFAVKAHLGVDALVRAFDASTAKLTRIIVHMITIIFSAGILVHGGIVLVAKSYAKASVFPSTSMPMGAVYLAFPIAGIFIIVSAIEFIIEENNSEIEKEVV